MANKKLVVFTPTFNRANTLERLYKSLCNQTCQDFYWLIVDDGSTDGTEQTVEVWQAEDKIDIVYYKQENKGKSLAHNKGVELAESELFVCVDSDDYLTTNAVERILSCWNETDKTAVGILAFKKTEEKIITTIKDETENLLTTLKNAYDHHGLSGDTMLVFRTDIIKKYSFPDIKGEKFVPEAYLYDLIDQDGGLMILREALYVCEYLGDGYTANMAKLIKNNPIGYIMYINQRLNFDRSFKDRFLDSIRYVAITKVVSGYKTIQESVYPVITLLAYPFGVLFYYKRYKNV